MSLIYLIYIIYVALFAAFSYLALYHIWRFGFVGDATKKVIYGYIGIVGLIVVATLILIAVI
jgi:hypothetical protein